jgi:hypothetical protein
MIRRPLLGAALAAVIALLGLAAPSASAAAPVPAAVASTAVSRNVSAFSYLKTHDGSLDANWDNFSIATALLRDLSKTGKTDLTAPLFAPRTRLTFLVPTDRAFQTLLKQVTGYTYATEARVLKKLEFLQADDVDSLLGYGIVRSRTLTASAVVASAGRNLPTAWPGRTIHVAVYGSGPRAIVSLWDQDHRWRNPRLIRASANRNAGNPQILHGIDRVALGFHEQMSRSWFIDAFDSLYDLLHHPCTADFGCTGGSSGHG